MPDNNTVHLIKDDDGETIAIYYDVARVPVAPIITHQNNIVCNSFDMDFGEKIQALKAGQKCSYTFPVPVRFVYDGGLWFVRRFKNTIAA